MQPRPLCSPAYLEVTHGVPVVLVKNDGVCSGEVQPQPTHLSGADGCGREKGEGERGRGREGGEAACLCCQQQDVHRGVAVESGRVWGVRVWGVRVWESGPSLVDNTVTLVDRHGAVQTQVGHGRQVLPGKRGCIIPLTPHPPPPHWSRSCSMISSMLLYWQNTSTLCSPTTAPPPPPSSPSTRTPMPQSCSSCLHQRGAERPFQCSLRSPIVRAL